MRVVALLLVLAVSACGKAQAAPRDGLVIGTGNPDLRVAFAAAWIDDASESLSVGAAGRFSVPATANAVAVFVDSNGDRRLSAATERAMPCILEDERWRCEWVEPRVVFRSAHANGAAEASAFEVYVPDAGWRVEPCHGDGGCESGAAEAAGPYLAYRRCATPDSVSIRAADVALETTSIDRLPLRVTKTTTSASYVEVEVSEPIHRARSWVGAVDAADGYLTAEIDGRVVRSHVPESVRAACMAKEGCDVWVQMVRFDTTLEQGVRVDRSREVYASLRELTP